MLSINIPVYNIEVSNLVLHLAKQANALRLEYEIRVYDDGSEELIKKKNREIKTIPQVIYCEMEQNLGRARIRNKMGLDSQKSYLLFIDADSRISSDDYLKNYVEHANPGNVFCGGTSYSNNKPANEKLLRWVYGHQREAISAEVRNSQKGFIITSNNFLIEREIFNHIHFRENLGPYGHEDTLLGFDLFSAGIKPLHINNPVEHTGLEDSGIFLIKTKKALENLHFISENVVNNSPEFKSKINFLKQYNKITKIIPSMVLVWFFKIFRKAIEKNLTGTNPQLFWFDVYKLGYYASISKKKD